MNVKNLVLGIGIFIVYMLMLGYGIEAFYHSPKYEDFCKNNYGERYPVKAYPNYAEPGTNCTFSKSLQEQTDKCSVDGGFAVYNYNDNGCTTELKKCDYCQKDFNNAEKEYSKIVFIIALITGLITLFIGYGILSIEPVGSALMASGIGAIFYGSVRNWANLSDIWRFLLLLVALIFLIWIALRINKQRKKGKK